MDKEYLEARLASIQTGLEREVNNLETSANSGLFEELSIRELEGIYVSLQARIVGFDNLVNLMQETREWLK